MLTVPLFINAVLSATAIQKEDTALINLYIRVVHSDIHMCECHLKEMLVPENLLKKVLEK